MNASCSLDLAVSSVSTLQSKINKTTGPGAQGGTHTWIENYAHARDLPPLEKMALRSLSLAPTAGEAGRYYHANGKINQFCSELPSVHLLQLNVCGLQKNCAVLFQIVNGRKPFYRPAWSNVYICSYIQTCVSFFSLPLVGY